MQGVPISTKLSTLSAVESIMSQMNRFNMVLRIGLLFRRVRAVLALPDSFGKFLHLGVYHLQQIYEKGKFMESHIVSVGFIGKISVY